MRSFDEHTQCLPLQERVLEFAFLSRADPGRGMDVVNQVCKAIDEVLSLGGRGLAFTRDTPLLGAIPELDSMAVVTLITTLEERFGISVDDDDIDGSTFASVGALADFVSARASV